MPIHKRRINELFICTIFQTNKKTRTFFSNFAGFKQELPINNHMKRVAGGGEKTDLSRLMIINDWEDRNILKHRRKNSSVVRQYPQV